MIRIEPEDQQVLSGSKVRFDCGAVGESVVVWTQGDGSPVYQDSLVTVTTNGSLLFSSADRSHEGMYTCFVIGNSGVVKKQAHLTVTIKKGWYISEHRLLHSCCVAHM